MEALSLSLVAVGGVPLVKPGDALPGIIEQALAANDLELNDHDVLVIAQKIVSKAEGRIINLAEVTPGVQASKLAVEVEKDPRLVELILGESRRVVRHKPGVLIVEHNSGIIMANAGIDHSNVKEPGSGEYVTLLPLDANKSAKKLRQAIETAAGRSIGVVINDSVGRAWRNGTVGIAIGSSGITPLNDLRGEKDLFGSVLEVSETADADSLASAACLLMGEAADASPLVLVRGYPMVISEQDSSVLIRDAESDLFR